MQIGWTPLHAVANYCPVDKAMPVAKLLLDAGAAVDAANSVSHLSGESSRVKHGEDVQGLGERR